MRNRKSRLSLAMLIAAAMTVGACSCDDPGSGAVKGKPNIKGPAVTADPERKADYLVDFGAVAIGSAAKQLEVQVENVGAAPLTISNLAAGAPFGVSPSESFTINVNETSSIFFSYKPTEEREDEVVAKVPTDGGQTTFRLRGKGVLPQFTCDPMKVDFGNVEAGMRVDASITCTNNTEIPTLLTSSEMRGNNRELFSVGSRGEGLSLEIPPRGEVSVPVRFINASGSGVRTADFTLFANEYEIGVVHMQAQAIADALEITPSCSDNHGLDFGYIAVTGREERTLLLRNVGSKPIHVERLEIAQGSSPAFSVPFPSGFTILPDDPNTPELENEHEMVVAFQPTEIGPQSARVSIVRQGRDIPTEACVRGFGGGPQIACTPTQQDFGIVAVETSRTRTFLCENVGIDDPAEPILDNLFVTDIEVSDPAIFSARIVNEDGSEGPAATGYAAGKGFELEVTYAPVVTNFDTGQITVVSNDGLNEEYVLNVSGDGRELPPCDFDIFPDELRYGIVAPGSQATLDFRIRNNQPWECIIYDLRAETDGTTEAFFTELVDQIVLEPGPDTDMRIPVTFAPPAGSGGDTPTVFTGRVLFDISDPANPNQEVDLRGSSMQPCVEIKPSHLDFGTAVPGCQTRDREIQVINGCEQDVAIQDIYMNVGSSCEDPFGSTIEDCEFAITRLPGLLPSDPIKPGERLTFDMVYRPADLGDDVGSVLIEMVGEAEPYMVTLQARGATNARHTDVFTQSQRPKVDLLWVIDNSGSMSSHQANVAQNLPYFVAFALSEQIDFQVGVTTTDVDSSGERGRLVPIPPTSSPRILSMYTPNLEDHWNAAIRVGTVGSASEKGLEAAKMAMELRNLADDPSTPAPNDGNLGLVRTDAALSIIVVSDEADYSGGPTDQYLDYFRQIKGYSNPSMFKFHGIIPDPITGCSGAWDDGDRYYSVIEPTEGVWESICTDNWQETLEKIGQNAFGFSSRFFLTNYPACDGECNELGNPPAVEVKVDGVPIASRNNRERVWSYHAQTNAIDFNPSYIPSPGVQVEVTYQVQCIAIPDEA